MTVLGILFAPAHLRLFTDNEKVLAAGKEYSYIIFGMCAFLIVAVTFEKIYQAMGNMVLTMAAMMAGSIVNIILDPLFIFGIGFFPKMGIKGAAVATGLGWVTTFAIYVAAYFIKDFPLKVRVQDMKPTKEICLKMYRVGIPATLNMALPSVLISALNGILTIYSQMYVVILGIYFKLQSFIYLPANGIIQGMRPLISYNFGAGEKMRVRRIFRISLEMIVVIMCVGTALCQFCPGLLMGMFTESTKTLSEGAKALRIISGGFIISAVSVVCAGALEALGKGFSSLIITLMRYVIIILPAAWIGSRLLGAVGVWWAFVVAEVITAVVAIFIWKRQKISAE